MSAESPESASPASSTPILQGKRVLISGASRGIGRGIALEMASVGAEVTINYHSNESEAEDVVRECEAMGTTAHAVGADISDETKVQELVDQACERMGGLDIVVSNAAYSDRHLMLESDMDEFRRTIDVSMWGAFHLVRCGARKMVDAGNGGNIVVISSPHAHMPMPGAMAYNMAKAANDQMARTAAVELASHRIRVNIIHPGWIDTPGERKFFQEETLQTEGAKLPWGRLGQIREIGRGAVFLCDPKSEYITGSTLTIDGGIQLPWREMYRVEEARREPVGS
ncbi:SDR family NAD(P)-dependent oxidoreductase [Rhodopirellula halodulae]|uniref:SDR family NAD(P)-dependent oxidoreductase n=1 Tax=Rhodopirellula halodulae TaxID=2894198 RepID=UPI001E52364A|nr:SDR family oxidoreductase [Rhodopirellula sp. JC737]MCC9657542.1 SDR family oxidoreductase [Rhodopirellula sp. JC737]